MKKTDLYYIKIAYKEAKKAYKKNEIPVGCVIVQDNKIISRGHNLRDNKKIVTKHAEIIAIEKANKKINNWRIMNGIIYTTLEPCNMCYEVIKESKIKRIVYILDNRNSDKRRKIDLEKINDSKIAFEYQTLLNNAFKNIRLK